MRIRTELTALPLLVLAAAALAAPPLSIPIPRPTPEQEAQMMAEAEEDRIREEIEKARLQAEETAAPDEPAPTAPPVAPTASPARPPAPPVAPTASPARPPATPVAPTASPARPPAPPVASTASPAEPATPAVAPSVREAGSASEDSAPGSGSDAFRRDPFWPLAVTRARKADHEARIAAKIEAERRAALIEKKRQEAIARGEDVELLDDELDVAGGATAESSGTSKHSSESFGGASGEEWDAAFAKIPPRSGYLGGKRPALMLKGDKTPHYAGEKICVTNRNMVFTWRIATVDFRSYTHELKRVSVKPLP